MSRKRLCMLGSIFIVVIVVILAVTLTELNKKSAEQHEQSAAQSAKISSGAYYNYFDSSLAPTPSFIPNKEIEDLLLKTAKGSKKGKKDPKNDPEGAHDVFSEEYNPWENVSYHQVISFCLILT